MKRSLFILVASIIALINMSTAEGQEGRRVKVVPGAGQGYTRIFPEGGEFRFDAAVGEVMFSQVAQDSFSVRIPGFYHMGIPGELSLPSLSVLFEAGRDAVTGFSIERLDSALYDPEALGLSGSPEHFREPARKSGNHIGEDGMEGAKHIPLGRPLLETVFEGKMRGVQISKLRFNPVHVDPESGQIKVYYNIRCTIHVKKGKRDKAGVGHVFSGIRSRIAMQDGYASKKAIMSDMPVTLVILSDTMFREPLRPLVSWKTMKGFRVVEGYRQDSAVGNTRESIKSWLKGLYEDPPEGIQAPSYLLIVGDVEQIPLSQSTGQITDLYYATYDGEGDYLPELFYGRISVNSKEQLDAVVEKILEYEQHRFPDPSFLEKSVLIAGVDGSYASTYGNGQINYAREQYLNEGNGVFSHAFLYPGSDTARQAILSLVSEGVGFVNYTGHGEADRWRDPAFLSDDVSGLQNMGRYPVMVGNGCRTNMFTVPECFAEALLRAPEKGALAYIGGTNDSYWDEDFYWAVGVGPVMVHPEYIEGAIGFYDRIFHTHGEDYPVWTPSLGEMVFGGNMAVQQSSSHRKKFYWEIYQLAGDPSLVPWFSPPAENEVVHPGVIPAGTGRVDVQCAPYSYLAISLDGILLDALHATGEGVATLSIPDTITAGELELVVTGDRHQPYRTQLPVGVPAGTYIDLLGYSLSGETVEPDGYINPGETFTLDLRIVNRGDAPLIADTLLLTCGTGQVEISDSLLPVAGLAAGDTLLLQNVFRIGTDNLAPDQEKVLLAMGLAGGDRKSFITTIVHAPRLVPGRIFWDDRPEGNGNGTAEAGEQLLVSWTLHNKGHFRTGAVNGVLIEPDPLLFSEIKFINSPVIPPGDSASLECRMELADPGKGLHWSGLISAGDQYGFVTGGFSFVMERHFEDFESGLAANFPFENDDIAPWQQDFETYSSPQSAVRSGMIPDLGSSSFSVSFQTTSADSLSFAFRVSSEKGWDFLKLYAEDTLVARWSGETDWDRYSFPVGAGSHRIRWVYQKDQSSRRGEDAAWIDDIAFPQSAFRSGDLALTAISSPVSGPWLSELEQVELRIRNTSPDTIFGCGVDVRVDGIQVATEIVPRTILPEEEFVLVPEGVADMSALGHYLLEATITSDSGYAGNNRIRKLVEHYLYPDLALSLDRLEEQPGHMVHARCLIENLGNTSLDSIPYELWQNDRLYGTGFLTLQIDPAWQEAVDFLLADSMDNLVPGIHSFRIKLAVSDSVPENNIIEGAFSWQATGTSLKGGKERWKVYPNPARSGFIVRLAEPASKVFRFELCTMEGRVVASFLMEKGADRLFIPAGRYGPGQYILRRNGNGQAVKQVILH